MLMKAKDVRAILERRPVLNPRGLVILSKRPPKRIIAELWAPRTDFLSVP